MDGSYQQLGKWGTRGKDDYGSGHCYLGARHMHAMDQAVNDAQKTTKELAELRRTVRRLERQLQRIRASDFSRLASGRAEEMLATLGRQTDLRSASDEPTANEAPLTRTPSSGFHGHV